VSLNGAKKQTKKGKQRKTKKMAGTFLIGSRVPPSFSFFSQITRQEKRQVLKDFPHIFTLTVATTATTTTAATTTAALFSLSFLSF